MAKKQESIFKFLNKVPAEPPVKKTKTTEEKIDQRRAYEKDGRERHVLKGWERDHPWLLFTADKLFCKPCRQIYGPLGEDMRRRGERNQYTKLSAGPFVTGCANLKRDALNTHEKGKGHAEAVTRVAAKKEPLNTDANRIIQSLHKSTNEKVDKLFKTAHALAKKSRPFSDFSWQCDLDKSKGLDVGSTYQNDKSCRVIIGAIANTEREKIAKFIEEAKFVTVMSDGSTDVSVIENEIIYLRFSIKGVVHVVFIAIVAVPKANSRGILNAIKNGFAYVCKTPEDVDKILGKLIAYCCDGASVNTGMQNGVIALMRREISDTIVLVHCLVHRLELGYKDSIKGIKAYDKLMTMMSQIYTFYHTSPLHRANLMTTFQVLKQKEVIPLRVGGTRWISHTCNALENFYAGYEGIVMHLGQVGQEGDAKNRSKAQGILKLVKTKSIVMFGLFLRDLIVILKNLSVSLQRTSANLYDCHEKLKQTITSLEQAKSSPGYYQRKMEVDAISFNGHTLSGNLDMFNSAKPKVLDGLIASLQKRFKDVNEDVIKAIKVASLKSWPIVLEPDFGIEDIAVLVDYFTRTLEKNDVVCQNVDSEWISLRDVLYQNSSPQSLSWPDIFEKYSAEHSNVLTLFDLILSLPASTAECERGFSRMKITKTEYRNKLKATTLTDLMSIQLLSNEIGNFDTVPAVSHWMRSGQRLRRPNFMYTAAANDQMNNLALGVHAAEAAENILESTATAESAVVTAAPPCPSDTDLSDYESGDNSDYSTYDLSDNDDNDLIS